MTRSALILSFAFALALPALDVGCSSSSGGGTTGTGGSATGGAVGTGGTTSTGGSSTGGSATGGTTGLAGTPGGTGTGGAAGAGGRAGAGGGTAGASGGGGQAGAGAAGQTGRAGAGGNGNGGRGGSAGSSGGGGATATMTLTSTAFTEGMTIPAAQTCTGNSNMSPPLTWTAGPAATMSYGLALHDMTNDAVHWVIWDIPASTTSLPGNLPTTQKLTTPVMAQQHNAFSSDGYYGPCPMGSTHTYVFEVYALDVATLPSVTATSQTKTIRSQMMTHALAMGTLSGTSNASR